ncbi:MAG: TolC family protein, partial [Campylobacterota bacterium]|nr:TolC family protein [Campylobacterota bacterium]
MTTTIKDELKEISFDENLKLDEENIQNRSELKASESLVKSYGYSTKANEGAYMPRVDASLSFNKYGDELALNGRSGYPDTQKTATLNLNWNLYKGDADRLNVLKSKNKTNQTKMQYEDLKQKIQLQYEDAKEQLNLSKLNLATSKKVLELSKLNYEIVQNKLKEGVASNKDLIDANYLLTKSKQNYADAYYARYLAVVTLERV